jgi:polyisoprenoid-binding protein YceI
MNLHRSAAAISLCILSLLGCTKKNPKVSAPVALSATPAASPSAPGSASVPTIINYTFASTGETTLKFVGADVTGSHEGTIGIFSGAIVVSNGDPEQASVSVDLDLGSLHTADPKLESALKSAEFLNVAAYPRARFVSTSVVHGGELGATDTIRGGLQLHGVTHPIEIPATLHVRANGVDVDAELTIHRKDFGLKFAGKRDALIKDEIVVSLTVVASPVEAR